MENKETIKMNIAEAVTVNDLMNAAKFGDTNIETITNLLEFKFALSKIVSNKDEFLKQSVDSVKTNEYKHLSEKEDKTEEEKKEFEQMSEAINKKLNDIFNKYLANTVDIEIQKIDKEEFYKFCKTNEFTVAVIEFLYNKIVK